MSVLRLRPAVPSRIPQDFPHYCHLEQETQLLLGDRATRKHAKDSLNGRGNDNLG